MSSLLDVLTQSLGGSAVEQISRKLGANPQTVEQALPSALGTLVVGLSRNSASSGGAEALAGALSRDHDGSILDNLGGFLNDPEGGPGEGILGHVLGSKRPAVESGLSSSTGLDATTVTKLLTMLAPIVMGALGRTQRQQGLDVGGLASMLAGEREQIGRAAPAALGGLERILDTDGDGQVADAVAKLGAGLLGRFFGRK